MKKKKSFLSVCLFISLMFGCFAPSISAYAVGDSWTSAETYHYFENNFDDINTRLNGVIFNQNQLQEDFEDFLDEYRDNYNIPSGTSTDTWIGDNISGTYHNGSSGDADLTFSDSIRQAMRDWCNTYIETNYGYQYVYSYNSAQFLNKFNDQTHYHAFLDLINSGDNYYIAYSPSNDRFILMQANGAYFQDGEQTADRPNVIPTYNWNSVVNYRIYSWNSSESSYSLSSENSGSGFYPTSRKNLNNNPNFGYTGYYLLDLNTTKYLVYNSLDALRGGSEGVQGYYTVEGSYNSDIQGSYNTTTNNITSTLNSSDVNNYINNYYVQNGSYPSPNDVNIYITNNINNGAGSGGNGSGDNNGPNWDFGFLGTIGEFLAELISGIGEVIGGILSGLSSIISSLRDGFPNVIGSLLEYFLPFLPDEVVTMISLSIVFAILVGIIKIFRS